jgi:FkbM family methyltransferase
MAGVHRCPIQIREVRKHEGGRQMSRQEVVIPVIRTGGFKNVSWAMSWKSEILAHFVDAASGSFIDVGANLGQTLLDLYSISPKIAYIGFEPNIACAAYLKKLIQINVLRNYRVIPVALSDQNICRPLYLRRGKLTDPCGSVIPDLRPNRVFDVDTVPCFRFDDIQKWLKLGKIGFIKIDVEGAELEVLSGMKTTVKEYRPFILCEVLFTDRNANITTSRQRNEMLLELLTQMDYCVRQLVKSPDLAHVVDARKCREFASAYWSNENKELCDYLFIPNEKIMRVKNYIDGGQAKGH